MRASSVGVAALALLAAWVHGPGTTANEKELAAAFAGKRVVLCGASYGIGAEIAYGLARANASLLLAARSAQKLEGVAAKCRDLGATSVHVKAVDLSTKAGSRDAIESAEELMGGIDVLVLNHVLGMYEDWGERILKGHKEGTLDEDLGFVDKIMTVNTLSYIYLSSYALPAIVRSQGSLVAVGSIAGVLGAPRTAPYSASKHAVFGYFDSLRQDLAASHNESLQRVSITTGVLGTFDTEGARENTGGKLDFLTWHPPEDAAAALLTATARRWRTVYVPWVQARPLTLLQPLIPALDWVVRQFSA